jgi:hypothetical protein
MLLFQTCRLLPSHGAFCDGLEVRTTIELRRELVGEAYD